MVDDKRRGGLPSLPRIPLRGWRDILGRVAASVSSDRLPLTAAGVAFFVMLALLPTIIALLTIIAGLNVAYGEREMRGFLRLRGLALLFAVGTLVVVAVGLGVGAAVPVVLDLIGADAATRTVVNLVRWVGGVLFAGLVLAVLYRFGPDREAARWNWVSLGSAVAVVVWLAGSAGFTCT